MMNSLAGTCAFLVDEEADARQPLQGMLQAAGMQVQVFATGEEFLASYKPTLAGCVVIEYFLPQMTGLDVLKTLRTDGPPPPFVFHTRPVGVEVAVELFSAGARDLFIKPASLENLTQAVRLAAIQDALLRNNYLYSLEIRDRLALLTPPELEVVKLLSAGLLNKQIAAKLNVAVRTVELRRANIFKKMGVTSLGDLLRMVIFQEIYALNFNQD